MAKSKDTDTIANRRQQQEDRIAEYVRRTVAAAPPISASQRAALALIFRGSTHPKTSNVTPVHHRVVA